MGQRLRAVKGLVYPEAASLERVRKAGGLSKLTEEERVKVRLRRIEPGGWCDDLPAESRAHLIDKGTVEIVEVQDEERAPRGRRAVKED